MIVRYDSFVLEKCMKPAGNFLYVREGALGGEGYAVQICVRIRNPEQIRTHICTVYPADVVTQLWGLRQ